MHSFLIAITDIGDSAVILAVTATTSLYLLGSGNRRGAAFLSLAFALAVVGIGGCKILLMGCGSLLRNASIRSPSGHTALSMAVFWALAMLVTWRLSGWKRHAAYGLTVMLVGAIALSRVLLDFHSAAEVYIGFLIGLAAVFIAYLLCLSHKELPGYSVRALLLWPAASVLILHGVRLPAEEWMHMIVFHVKNYVPFCGPKNL